jgi:hypothetical protein
MAENGWELAGANFSASRWRAVSRPLAVVRATFAGEVHAVGQRLDMNCRASASRPGIADSLGNSQQGCVARRSVLAVPTPTDTGGIA